MSEQPSTLESTVGLVVQTIFFLAAVIGIPAAFALGGQLRSLALAAVGVVLLGGFLVVGYRHARRRNSLHQHVTFLIVWFGGIVLADGLACTASGRLPAPGPSFVAVGVTLGSLWLGARLAYGGVLTRALFGPS